MNTERTDVSDKRDSVVVIVRDTLREVTTITVQENERGDTLRVTTVTDREKIRDTNRSRVQDSRVTVKTDTVIVEKRDSVAVETKTDLMNRRPSALSYLKWIFWIIIGLIVLVVTVKVCLLMR